MDLFKSMPYGIKEIITNRMIASVAISPTGVLIPLLDTTAITAIWANMLYEIAKYHDVTLTTSECTKIITACGSSILGYLGGSKTLNWLLNFIPGVGTLCNPSKTLQTAESPNILLRVKKLGRGGPSHCFIFPQRWLLSSFVLLSLSSSLSISLEISHSSERVSDTWPPRALCRGGF